MIRENDWIINFFKDYLGAFDSNKLSFIFELNFAYLDQVGKKCYVH